MRHTPLIITLVASTGAHLVLLYSLVGVPTAEQRRQNPVVEIGLVHQVANVLASPGETPSPPAPAVCNPRTPSPENRNVATATAEDSPPASPARAAETTEEVASAAVEPEPPPTPLPSSASQPVDLVASESPAEHASTMPSTATAPACTYNPPPAYPAAALRQGWEGEVLLQAAIRTDGMVDTVNILKSSGHPALDHAAVAAVLTWQFAKSASVPVDDPIEVSIPVHFRIRNN